MDEDVVETGGDNRPTVGGSESIDPITGTGVYPIASSKKSLDFQPLESVIDRLPTFPSISRTKYPPAESPGENRAIFPCSKGKNKRIGHTLPRFRPGGATILTAKQTKAKRAGID
jgi:hypothetical protein